MDFSFTRLLGWMKRQHTYTNIRNPESRHYEGGNSDPVSRQVRRRLERPWELRRCLREIALRID